MKETNIHNNLKTDFHTKYIRRIYGTVNTGKTKYMEIGRYRGVIAIEHIRIGSDSYEKVKKNL